MTEILDERRVSMLAHRVGLELTRSRNGENRIVYQLVEPEAMIYVYPGGDANGVSLADLEDWLRFPWE
jgi:hypothetical protein